MDKGEIYFGEDKWTAGDLEKSWGFVYRGKLQTEINQKVGEMDVTYFIWSSVLQTK